MGAFECTCLHRQTRMHARTYEHTHGRQPVTLMPTFRDPVPFDAASPFTRRRASITCSTHASHLRDSRIQRCTHGWLFSGMHSFWSFSRMVRPWFRSRLVSIIYSCNTAMYNGGRVLLTWAECPGRQHTPRRPKATSPRDFVSAV